MRRRSWVDCVREFVVLLACDVLVIVVADPEGRMRNPVLTGVAKTMPCGFSFGAIMGNC